jgi:glycosyltransferase involved in cell wall biosynthesis
MPVYNAQRYLREAVDSLLGQTMGDFEIILCDNASTDSTGEICRRYAAADGRVRYHRNSKNLGVVANFNRAFELSRGRYFKWAAYDDLHGPTYLERCAAALDADPSLAVAHCLTRAIDEKGSDVGEFRASERLDAAAAADRFRRMIWTDAFPPIWGLMRSAMVRRTKLHGAYMGSDRNFLAELLLLGGVAYVPEYLFFIREHAGSYTAGVKDYYQRLRWYAPGRRVPSWMQVPRTAAGYLASIARSPISWGEKVECARHVMGWLSACGRGVVERRMGGLGGWWAQIEPRRSQRARRMELREVA